MSLNNRGDVAAENDEGMSMTSSQLDSDPLFHSSAHPGGLNGTRTDELSGTALVMLSTNEVSSKSLYITLST